MQNSSKIILIEDDKIIRESVAEILKLDGFEVFSYSNGAKALADLKDCEAEQPCLILLDLMMPGSVSAWDFLNIKRLNPPTVLAMPVFIMSSFVNSDSEAKEVGGSGYVKKPIDVDSLLKLVKSHCEPCDLAASQSESIS